MNVRTKLNRIFKVFLDEVEKNPALEAAIINVLDEQLKKKVSGKSSTSESSENTGTKRAKNRRPPAVLDPVQVVREGKLDLKNELEKLAIDQVKDIVAEFGMDPGRQIMKWVSKERIIERVIDISITRAHKGDAFRKPVIETASQTVQESSENSHQPDVNDVNPSSDN